MLVINGLFLISLLLCSLFVWIRAGLPGDRDSIPGKGGGYFL
jgi:hypothetical protein